MCLDASEPKAERVVKPQQLSYSLNSLNNLNNSLSLLSLSITINTITTINRDDDDDERAEPKAERVYLRMTGAFRSERSRRRSESTLAFSFLTAHCLNAQ